MNKVILGVVAVLLILVAGIGISRNKNEETAVTPTAQAPEKFVLAVLASEVSVKNPGDAQFKVVTKEAEITQGTEIKTSVTGRAKLLYPNGTVTTIEEDTHLKVEVLGKDGSESRIILFFGGMWSKVKNILAGGEFYEVETDNVVASVRGTIFSTQFRNNTAQVIGFESKVKVQGWDPKTKKLIVGTDVIVTTGEKITLRHDQAAQVDKKLVKELLSDSDVRLGTYKEGLLEAVEADDVTDENVRKLLEKIHDKNFDDKNFIDRIKAKGLLDRISSPSPSVSSSIKPTASATLKPTPSASVSPSATLSPLPSVNLNPILEFISPKAKSVGAKFTLNGRHFVTDRGQTKRISKVFIGDTETTFAYFFGDDTTLNITVPPLAPGRYEVTAIDDLGNKLVLPSDQQFEVLGGNSTPTL